MLRLYRFIVILGLTLLGSLCFGSLCIAGSLSSSPEARILSYQPLQVLVPLEQVNPILARQLQSFNGQVIQDGRNRFELSGLSHSVLPNGNLQLQFTVRAERPAPIVGKIKAKARARFEISVRLVDWSVVITALDSDIRFSNDLVQAAFQIVRPQVERQLLDRVQNALDEIKQPLDTDHPMLSRLRLQGNLSGQLRFDGLFVTLFKR